VPPIAYEPAARRHMTDAEVLFAAKRLANAGQLYGFVAECGVKALVIACGVKPDAQGGIPRSRPESHKDKHPLRVHLPTLMSNISADSQLIPDGIQATRYLALVPSRNNFHDWLIDHRYWREDSLPITSIHQWRAAAREINAMLDQAKQDGVL